MNEEIIKIENNTINETNLKKYRKYINQSYDKIVYMALLVVIALYIVIYGIPFLSNFSKMYFILFPEKVYMEAIRFIGLIVVLVILYCLWQRRKINISLLQQKQVLDTDEYDLIFHEDLFEVTNNQFNYEFSYSDIMSYVENDNELFLKMKNNLLLLCQMDNISLSQKETIIHRMSHPEIVSTSKENIDYAKLSFETIYDNDYLLCVRGNYINGEVIERIMKNLYNKRIFVSIGAVVILALICVVCFIINIMLNKYTYALQFLIIGILCLAIGLIIRSILSNQVNQLKQSCSNDVKKYYNLLFYEDRIEMYTGEKMTRAYDYHMFSSISKTPNEYILFNKNTPVLIIQYEQLNSQEAKTLENIISSKIRS